MKSLFTKKNIRTSNDRLKHRRQSAYRRCVVELLEDRRLLATDVWVGDGDGRTWLDPLNWKDGTVPGAGAEVLIPQLANTPFVQLPSTGSLQLKSIQSFEPLTLPGATLEISEAASLQQLTMTGGTISGAAEIQISGLFDWRGGKIVGSRSSGSVIVGGGLLIASGSRLLQGRTMSLDSNTQWTAGTWQIGGGATIINEPGRTWDIANVFLDDIDTVSTETIINRGILRKSSSIGTATLEFDLLDHRVGARVEATIGAIGMTGSFVSRGHWHVADGATIDWQQASASSELRTGTTSSGAGSLRLQAGLVSVMDDVTLAGAFVQNGGVMEGAGTLSLAGPFAWNGGTQGGEPDQRTVVTGGLTMVSGSRLLQGRTMSLDSNTQWTAGTWQIGGGATIINEPGRTWDIANVFLDDIDTASTETVINRGIFRKSLSIGTATIEANNVNHGDMAIEIGTLSFTNGLVQEGGVITLSGGTLQSTGLYDLQGGVLTGYGQVKASLRNQGLVRPGAPIGSMELVGNLEQGASGVLEIQWANDADTYDRLVVTGTATLGGTLRLVAEAPFVPALESTITPITYGSRTGEFASVQSLVGAGRAAEISYLAKAAAFTVVESSVSDADFASQQWNLGTEAIRSRGNIWSTMIGLPENALPLVGSGLDQALGLWDQFEESLASGIPNIAESVASYDALRTVLEAMGMTVHYVSGDPDCPADEKVRAQWDYRVDGLQVSLPVDALPPEVLQGLGDSVTLTGMVELNTDLVFSLILGVDGVGFYMDGSSWIRLEDLTVVGSLSGSMQLGENSDPVPLTGEGSGTGTYQITLMPADAEHRYRTESLWGEPSQLLRVSIEGETTLGLDMEIGPADLTWVGQFSIAMDASGQVDVALQEMELRGFLSLPELTRWVEGIPEQGFVAVDATYLSGTNEWKILANAEASAIYELGGLEIREIEFEAFAGPSRFIGDFRGVLKVPFGQSDESLEVTLDLEFGRYTLSGVVVTQVEELSIGDDLLWVQDLELTSTFDLGFHPPEFEIDFLVTIGQAVLFPEEPVAPDTTPDGVATLTGIVGSLSREGMINLGIQYAHANFSAFTIEAVGSENGAIPAIQLEIGPNQSTDARVLRIETATLEFTALEAPLALSASQMEFKRDGTFSMSEAELNASEGTFQALGLAGILPFDVTRIHVAGIANQRFTTEDFAATITIDGVFDFAYLEDTPLENLTVTIGDQGAENEFQFVFFVENGTVGIEDTGPITIAISDMEFGPLVIQASLTVGAYVEGEFFDNDATKGITFSGFFEADWMGDEATVGAGVTIHEGSLDLQSGVSRLKMNASFDVSFDHPESPLTFEDLGMTFDLSLDVSSDFQIENFELNVLNAFADKVLIRFGDLFLMEAQNVNFDFTVFEQADAPEEPFVTFGDNGLTLQFGEPGDAGNPLSGLGGSASNFGLGYVPGTGDEPPRPRFYQLPNFSVNVTLPDLFPDWLPIKLSEFGFRFPEGDFSLGDDGETIGIDDLSNVSILASGGMQGSPEAWPITGLVEDIEISIQALRTWGEYLIDNNMLAGGSVLDAIQNNLIGLLTSGAGPFPITNLDAVEIAIEPIDIGGVAIGGGLGLGILDIDSDGDGIDDTTSFYGRVLGQLVYSDMGFGAEVILSQYGPVLGRLYVGVPVPIGGLVGAVVGAFFFGVGAAAGYQIGDRTGFILTGFEGGMTFGDPLAEITDPLDILYNDQIRAPLKIDLETTKQKIAHAVRNEEWTWDSGFTLAVTGVLTNTYVNGLIASRVTLGANVGYGDEAGFQLYGISDVLEVMDFPVVSAGLLFDFSDPSAPSINTAFALPGTANSPLAMLFPAQGNLGIRLTTDGVSDATIAATSQFISALLDGSLEFGAAIFDAALTDLAGMLEAERVRRQATGQWSVHGSDIPSKLLHLIVDVDANDTLSAVERSVPIDRPRLVARTQQILAGAPTRAAMLTESFVSGLLDAATQFVGRLEPNDPAIAQLNGINQGDFLSKLADLVETLPIDFYQPSIGAPSSQWPSMPQVMAALEPLQQAAQHSKEIYAAFAYHVQKAMLASAETLFEIADPAITIGGSIQPYLLGIPMGDALGQVEGRLDKHGVTLSIDTSLGTLFNAATLIGSILGGPDIPVGMTVSLPIGDAMRSILFDGGDFNPLDPDDQRWFMELRTGLRVANFDLATIKGLGFPSGAANEESLLDRLQQVWLNPELPIDKDRIPIQSEEHFEAITTHGGILLSGILQVPRLITEPMALLQSLNLQVPESVLDYPGWLDDIVTALTQIETPGRFQLFAPSIAAGLTLNLEDPCFGIAPEDCGEDRRILRNEEKIRQIVLDAYVEGTWEGKLLGIQLGKARVDGTAEGLEIELEDPLLGLQITVLASMDERQINGKTVSFPRAKAEVTLDSEQAIGLLDQFKLPDQLRQDFVDAQGTLRWYSPGYSGAPNEPDRLKRVGGIEAQATLNANLFNVFQANFAGSITSTGAFVFEASNLSYSFPFPLGSGTINGKADFSMSGTLGSSNVDFDGDFLGALKVGRSTIASVSASIDAFGCLQGSLTYLNGTGTVPLPPHSLKPGACGPHLYVDAATFTEVDTNTVHYVTVRLSEPADHHVNIQYFIEMVTANEDSRDKATSSDVLFKSNQTVSIPVGQTQAMIPVTILGDNTWERSEIFRVRVASAPGVGLAVTEAIITILDDDIDNLVDSVLSALLPSDRALAWYDFQNSHHAFDPTVDATATYVAATPWTHSEGMDANGAAGLPDVEFIGRAASSDQWSRGNDYFEFTVTLDHNNPLNFFLDHLQFWDRTIKSKNTSRFVGDQEWQVYSSLDGFAVPLVREQSIEVNQAFFDENELPGGTRMDELLGWRRQRFLIESDAEGYAGQLPLAITFRLFGGLDVRSLIDNVELAGNVTAPCISGTEFSCLGRLVDGTQRLIDSILGAYEIRLEGPGSLATDFLWKGGEIDPIRFQEHLLTEIRGADPNRTILKIIAERPENFALDDFLALGKIRSPNGLLRIDVTGVPSVQTIIETGGPLRELAVRGLADGSLIDIGGHASQVTEINAIQDIGSLDGPGVSLKSLGTVEFNGKSWMNGSWDVASVTTADFVGGDFSPMVSIQGGFGAFKVTDGDFSPPTFASGLSHATRDGHGTSIQALRGPLGRGGSIHIGTMTIDGGLALLEANGGKINAAVQAASLGTVRAIRNTRSGDAGNIEGRYQADAMNLVQSIGGNVIATLSTVDAMHRDLRVEAFADPLYPDSGRIISRRSFLIAGGVEAIRAHDLSLRLVAGDRVELIELLGSGGRFDADLTATAFGSIRGSASHWDLLLAPTSNGQPSDPEQFEWEIQSNGADWMVDFQLANPHAPARLQFSTAIPNSPLVELERFSSMATLERVAGAIVGPLAIPATFQGQPLDVMIGDSRFELRDQVLVLKPDAHVLADENGGLLVAVSVTNADGTLQWRENLIVGIEENPFPWHHRERPMDADGDGFISPLDVLILINRINGNPNLLLPHVRSQVGGRDTWFDVDADGYVTPIDVLLVINQLNRGGGGGGEGEVASAWQFEEEDRKKRQADQAFAMQDLEQWLLRTGQDE